MGVMKHMMTENEKYLRDFGGLDPSDSMGYASGKILCFSKEDVSIELPERIFKFSSFSASNRTSSPG